MSGARRGGGRGRGRKILRFERMDGHGRRKRARNDEWGRGRKREGGGRGGREGEGGREDVKLRDRGSKREKEGKRDGKRKGGREGRKGWERWMEK